MRKTLLLTTFLTVLAIAPAAAQQPADTGAGTQAPAAAQQHADTVLIRSIQRGLVARGYFDGPVTGSVDAATEDAIRRYQAENGMRVDGVANHALANHIRTGETVAEANVRMQQGYGQGVGVALVAPEYAVSTADRWIALGQTLMAKAGVYEGPVNGIYDRPTRDAVIRFEADNGLPSTGRISDVLVQVLAGTLSPEEARAQAVAVPAVTEPVATTVPDYDWRYRGAYPWTHPYWNQDPGYPWPYSAPNTWYGHPYGQRYYRQGWGGGTTSMPGGSWGSVGR